MLKKLPLAGLIFISFLLIGAFSFVPNAKAAGELCIVDSNCSACEWCGIPFQCNRPSCHEEPACGKPGSLDERKTCLQNYCDASHDCPAGPLPNEPLFGCRYVKGSCGAECAVDSDCTARSGGQCNSGLCNYPNIPNCVATDCNGVNCSASGQVCTITTNPCSCVTPTPTCSSTNCGACSNCTSCINNTSCGWNGPLSGGTCQAGTASCPAGSTQWYWDSCSTNACQAPTPSSPPTTTPVCGNNICETGEDYLSCRTDCPAPTPTLNSFSGNACFNNPYSATLSWSGVSLPSTDSGCPNGFWVDIDDNSSFSSYSNKCVQGTSTNSPDGFGGPGGAFSFQSGATYWARVYNGSHSNTRSFTVPTAPCSASCSLSASCSGTTCTFNTSYTINSQSQSSYQVNLHPDVNNYSVQSGFQASGPISHTYTPGSYTARAEVKKNDGTSPVTCDKAVTISSWNSPQCSATGTFTGCSVGTNARCSDYGSSSYPNWSQNLWNTCNDACKRPNPDTYCKGTPSCSVSVGAVTRNTSGTYSNTTVNWNSQNMGGSKVWYYNAGTCSGSSCPSSGWSQITSAGFDAQNSYNWNPNGVAPTAGGTRTVGVSDPNNVLRCTTDVSFPTPNQGCTLTANPNQSKKPVTSTLTASVNTAGMPDSKMSQWDLDGNGSFETTDTKLSNSVFTSTTKTYSFRVVDGAKSSSDPGYILANACSTPVTIDTTAPPPTSSGGSCNSPYSCMSGLGANCYESSQQASNYCKSLGYNYCGLCQQTSLWSIPVRIKVMETTNPVPPAPWPYCSYPTTLNGCLDKNNTCVANYLTSTPGQCYVPIISESASPVNCPGEESGYSYCGTNPGANSSCVFTKPWTYTSKDSETGETFSYQQQACFLRTYGDITACSNASYSMSCFGTDTPNPPAKGVKGVKVWATCTTHLGRLGDEYASRLGTTGAFGEVTIDVPYTYIEGSGGYKNVDCIARLADNPDNPPRLVWGSSRYWNNIVSVYHYDTGKTDPGGRIPIIASTISQIFLQTSGPNANSYQIQGDGPNYLFVIQEKTSPWIQTTGGDVHSNTNINTPGGP